MPVTAVYFQMLDITSSRAQLTPFQAKLFTSKMHISVKKSLCLLCSVMATILKKVNKHGGVKGKSEESMKKVAEKIKLYNW